MRNYHFILISSVVLITYIGSVILVKLKKIDPIKQRQFWNVTLLISFLISGVFGLILAFLIDQKISFRWYLLLLQLHVEMGIVMAIASIFHLSWHLKYFGLMLKRKR